MADLKRMLNSGIDPGERHGAKKNPSKKKPKNV